MKAKSLKGLKGFQEAAVESGVSLFAAAKKQLDVAGVDTAGRDLAINHNGYLLIEAPTGAGKTLIAGTLVERFSQVEDVVWFWFAPFKGVVGQTADFLREQFHGLRLRELSEDRSAGASKRGDVFVTTWQAVATKIKDSRNVRKDGDLNPSLDNLLEMLRNQGLRIGVVVDEAHHSFGKGTIAAKFFREVLRPEYTVLITATPDDDEIKTFEKEMEIAELHRISVSRTDAVEAGLIKRGVKCAAYYADSEKKYLADMQGIALADGVAAHRALKKELADLKVPLIPLLLVQADSTPKSIEKIKERLIRLGFSEEQIAVHTADEPDTNLLSLANDESREVLVFKMAVALGFDAPRAFTLVSMRASRDSDFGLQLVGRILRVHRLLHGRAQSNKLPEKLRYGYVFLADAETQSGLDVAGQKINQIQTQYAKASAATVVLRYGDGTTGVAMADPSGRTPLFRLEGGSAGKKSLAPDANLDDTLVTPKSPREFDFGQFFGNEQPGDETLEGDSSDRVRAPIKVVGPLLPNRYPLRDGVPRQFKTQIVSGQVEVTEEDCANRFMISTRDLLDVFKKDVRVEMKTLEIFTREWQKEIKYTELSPEQVAKDAHRELISNQTFDPRELRNALLKKVAMVLRDEEMKEADEKEKVAYFLNVLLATKPELLRDAQKAAIRQHAELKQTDEPLPLELQSEQPLPSSNLNVYGVMPPDLNSWERAFAEFLDRDSNQIVKWWHRNLPRKPWSVNVLMPDGRGFYPDFVVGINGRKTEDNALLADPKFHYQTEEGTAKVQAEHRSYGRVMILDLEGGARWWTVGYDEKLHKAIKAREFRLTDAAGF